MKYLWILITIVFVAGSVFWGAIVVAVIAGEQPAEEYQAPDSSNLAVIETPVVPVNSANIESAINEYRATRGLKSLAKLDSLCVLAEARLLEIASDFSHGGFRQRMESGEAFDLYCDKCSRIGENLARAFYTIDDLMLSWQESEKHRKNMLDNWTHQCVVTSGTYTVSLFSLSSE